jgi:hypothetical protein
MPKIVNRRKSCTTQDIDGDVHLLRRIQLKTAGADRRAGLHGDVDRVRESVPPRRQEARLDRAVLEDSGLGHAVPCARVRGESASETVVSTLRRSLEGGRRGRRSPPESVREGLVLDRSSGDGRWYGKIGALQVNSSEVLIRKKIMSDRLVSHSI